MKKYLVNLLISLDQFGNTLFGGDPDETISSRLGKWKKGEEKGVRKVTQKVLCKFLGWIDPRHCLKSIEDDEGNDGVIR